MSTPALRRGRPPVAGEKKRGSFTTRLRADVRTALDAEAAAAGRSLSEEIEIMCEWRLRTADRAPLLHLFEHVARAVDPHNQWADNSPAGAMARRALIRGLSRAMERLAHPQDPGYFSLEPGPEGSVDSLLDDAGRDTADRDPPVGVWAWASQVRRYLGPLGPLLMRINRTRRNHIWSRSPAVVHGADNLNLLQAALEQIGVILASTRLEASAIAAAGGEPPVNKIARLETVAAALTALMTGGERSVQFEVQGDRWPRNIASR